MATNYAKSFDLSDLGAAVGRITAAMVRGALTVYAENGATAGHAARALLATKVLNDPSQYGRVFTWAVVVAPSLDAKIATPGSITDADLDTAVAAAWNAIAGA